MELTKTFALICSTINKYFRTDDIAEWNKHLHQFCITELLWQMVDK